MRYNTIQTITLTLTLNVENTLTRKPRKRNMCFNSLCCIRYSYQNGRGTFQTRDAAIVNKDFCYFSAKFLMKTGTRRNIRLDELSYLVLIIRLLSVFIPDEVNTCNKNICPCSSSLVCC